MPKLLLVTREDREAAYAASLLVCLNKLNLKRFCKGFDISVDLKKKLIVINAHGINTRSLTLMAKDVRILKSQVARAMVKSVNFHSLQIRPATLIITFSF